MDKTRYTAELLKEKSINDQNRPMESIFLNIEHINIQLLDKKTPVFSRFVQNSLKSSQNK